VRLATALVFLAVLLVALVRKPLYDAHRRVKETSDLYALPPAPELRALTLGYRSAVADILWAHVLVSQGLHMEQKRRYESVTRLLEAITELEPTYREPYLFTDTLVTFQIGVTPPEEVRAARALMEKGVKNRPLDGDLWLTLGEFVAFIAPETYLRDPAEQAAWRVDGAHMLARAAELGGDQAAWQTIGGAAILTRSGERDAAIRFLKRALAVADDPELKDALQAHLVNLVGEQRDEAFRRVDAGVLAARHAELPQVSRPMYMLLGPPRDPAACAGPERAREPACAASWREWEERGEEATRAP
jgi:hypothetical protein